MANKLNKADLISAIAEKSSISKIEADRQLTNVMNGLEATLEGMKDGDVLQLVGLLTFEVKLKEEYVAKNPRTGEEVIVPAKNRLRVKAGSRLTDAVK